MSREVALVLGIAEIKASTDRTDGIALVFMQLVHMLDETLPVKVLGMTVRALKSNSVLLWNKLLFGTIGVLALYFAGNVTEVVLKVYVLALLKAVAALESHLMDPRGIFLVLFDF